MTYDFICSTLEDAQLLHNSVDPKNLKMIFGDAFSLVGESFTDSISFLEKEFLDYPISCVHFFSSTDLFFEFKRSHNLNDLASCVRCAPSGNLCSLMEYPYFFHNSYPNVFSCYISYKNTNKKSQIRSYYPARLATPSNKDQEFLKELIKFSKKK